MMDVTTQGSIVQSLIHSNTEHSLWYCETHQQCNSIVSVSIHTKLERYILIIVEYCGASSSSGVIGEVTGGTYPSDDWLYSRVNQGGSCRKYLQWTTK